MKGLLKADFYRIFKSPLFYILAGVGIFLSFITVPLAWGVNQSYIIASKAMDPSTPPIDIFVGKSAIAAIYGLSNNIGLILPILFILLTFKDVSDGTIRNKIISGNSRTKIYFSHVITVALVNLMLITIASGIVTGLTFLMMGYGVKIDLNEGLSLMFFYILGSMTFVFISTLIVALTLNTNIIALPLIFTIVIGVSLSLLSSTVGALISQAIASGFDLSKHVFIKILLYMIPTYPVGAFASTQITLEMFLFGLGVLVFLITLINVLGCISFNKRDLK